MPIRFKTSDGSIFDSREEAYEHNKGDPIEIVYNAGIDGAICPDDTPNHVDQEDPDILISQLEDTIRAANAHIRNLENRIQAYRNKTVPINIYRGLRSNYDKLLLKHQALEERLHNLEALNTPLQPRRFLPNTK